MWGLKERGISIVYELFNSYFVSEERFSSVVMDLNIKYIEGI
jgi:hypothetical protein